MILHVDMDAFFASVEQRDHPQLQGKPVVVGGDPHGRGIVTTCSYEARKFGIHSGMPSREAWQRCPSAIFVRSSGRKYQHASRLMLGVLDEISPVVEPFSIDEAFVDVTSSMRLFGSWEALSHFVRAEIENRTGVTGSIGIAPTKLAAKLASKVNKPNGITIISRKTLKEFLRPIPIESVMGVGPKTAPGYHSRGIITIGDLLDLPSGELASRMGKQALELRELLLDPSRSRVHSSPVTPSDKSMSHEHTFGKDTNNVEELQNTLLTLTEKVARRLRRKGLAGNRITLKLRNSDFSTHSHQTSLGGYTDSENRIYGAGVQLLDEMRLIPFPIRLIGIKVSRLKPVMLSPMELDLDGTFTRFSRIADTVDKLKDQFGDHIITRCSSLNVRHTRKGLVKSGIQWGFGGKLDRN